MKIIKICVQYITNQDCFLATVKTHKFPSVSEINLDQLKLHLISDQTGFAFTKRQRLWLDI